MSCCHHCRDADSLFNRRMAARQLARYRRRGPEGTTRLLIEQLLACGVVGARVLDIGGGVGVVHHELLRAGAAEALDIDAASAYLAAAQDESVRQGHAAQTSYREGDFVALADSVAGAEIVVLDRVICCYPEMAALVGAAAARADRLLGLVYPRDVWWVRVGVRAINGGFALQRRRFRLYCHPTAAVEAVITHAGLGVQARHTRGPWQVVVFARR
jgi:SAM-dependent methyltransferase